MFYLKISPWKVKANNSFASADSFSRPIWLYVTTQKAANSVSICMFIWRADTGVHGSEPCGEQTEKGLFCCIKYLWLSVLHALYFFADWGTVLISKPRWWMRKKMPPISSVLPDSQDILSCVALIDSLSVALIRIAVLHCDSLASNEVGSDINHPSHINRGDMHIALALFTVTSLQLKMTMDLSILDCVAETIFQSLWNIQWAINL